MRDKIFNEDCLEGMNRIQGGSIDMILCDLPYGTTACKWDSIIPLEALWAEYVRIIKDNGAIVLFGSEPFSTKVRNTALSLYRYDWVWDKGNAGNYPLAHRQPLKVTEDIMVFYKKQPVYHPQGLKPYGKVGKRGSTAKHLGGNDLELENFQAYTNYPKNILHFSKQKTDKEWHPTQKPTVLLTYLIKTYTDPGDTVLDNCMGSGSTAVACLHTGRHFIGFEKDPGIYEDCMSRVDKYVRANGKNSIEEFFGGV